MNCGLSLFILIFLKLYYDFFSYVLLYRQTYQYVKFILESL